jgi:Ca2+/Na+ antiporter
LLRALLLPLLLLGLLPVLLLLLLLFALLLSFLLLLLSRVIALLMLLLLLLFLLVLLRVHQPARPDQGQRADRRREDHPVEDSKSHEGLRPDMSSARRKRLQEARRLPTYSHDTVCTRT